MINSIVIFINLLAILSLITFTPPTRIATIAAWANVMSIVLNFCAVISLQ